MWYIVKTDFYREREAIDDLLRLDGVGEIYFPVSRRAMTEIGLPDDRHIRFKPIINGILFVYANSKEQLKAHLNARGYFLKDVEDRAASMTKRCQIEGNAHLFAPPAECANLDALLRRAMISDEDIYRYKVCIERSAANTDDIQIVDRSYAELVSDNDTVMITDGPFAGFTGVVKQVKSHGVKDRCLFFRLGNLCIKLSGVRRFCTVIIRESANGAKAQIPNMWRHIDFLTGRLQATSFPDSAQAALRSILFHYNKVSTLEECQTRLLRLSKGRASKAESHELASLADFLQQMDGREEGALKSLKRFFQSEDNSVATELDDLIPDMPLRPFLTPTSGIELPKDQNYVLFPHKGFTELIFRVNLMEDFHKVESGLLPKATDRQTAKVSDYTYYIHIALSDKVDGTGLTAMVNWGGFIHCYVHLSDEERSLFLANLEEKGYHETYRLLTHGHITHTSPVQAGFSVDIPDITLADITSQCCLHSSARHLPLSLVRSLHPVCQLVRSCIPAAVEFWQRQRFLEWRHLVQRFVLLHNLPLGEAE